MASRGDLLDNSDLMGGKKNSKSRAPLRFKVASPATAPSSAPVERNIESSVATLQPPDELEKRSWQSAIIVKKQTSWMLILTVAILIATIVLPFAVESFKSRVSEAQARSASGDAKQDQRANVEQGTASPANAEMQTIPTTETPDPKSSSSDAEKAPETQPDLKGSNSSLVASYLSQARAQYHQNKYSKALAACEKALRLDPHNQAAIALRNEIRETAQAMSDNDKQKP
jgi:tetratricopeptide (TPR) repeat protein